MTRFNVEQTKQLLAPINPRRVLADGKGHSHLPQQDVIAHLIRVLGFGNFMYELLNIELLFETPRVAEKVGARDRWDVAYKAAMRLTVLDPTGVVACIYEDVSTGDAQNQTRADAHDLAMKSAVSLAKKRCAIHLGDQFGLSLYNKGQTSALVVGTKVLPKNFDRESGATADVQVNVPLPESMGVDETVHTKDVSGIGSDEVSPEQEAALAKTLGATPIEGGGEE